MSEVTRTILERRLEGLRTDAEGLAGTARKIAQAIDQITDNGGALIIQAQMAFLTGALARMTKDWGVVEQLQSQGVVKRRPTITPMRRAL